jgi:flagellar hook-associated protein 2
LLSKFKDAVSALDTIQEVGSFTAASDNTAVVASANGSATPGSFKLEIGQLAAAFKSYSDPLGITQSNQALNQTGKLNLTVAGKSVELDIGATDTLDVVMNKINSSGLRVSASSFFDGTQFRMQLRGLDTGVENDVQVSETGTSFNFAGTDNVKSRGQDAQFTVDGFAVTSKSNQVQGVIGGVTLALTAKTTTPTTVTISSDSSAMAAKMKTLVDSYNAVVNSIHTQAGFGTTKATNSALAGDSTLRGITSALSNALSQTVGSGKFQTLRSIGVKLQNNGTLQLDTTVLNAALAEDPDAVTKVIAGDDKTTKGFADNLAALATDMLSASGSLQARKDGLAARQKDLSARADTEQARLDRMEETLRKQFTQMDQEVSASKAQAGFL